MVVVAALSAGRASTYPPMHETAAREGVSGTAPASVSKCGGLVAKATLLSNQPTRRPRLRSLELLPGINR
jgi:hypothetical protein